MGNLNLNKKNEFFNKNMYNQIYSNEFFMNKMKKFFKFLNQKKNINLDNISIEYIKLKINYLKL
jgi:hypothetical protein